jgi:PhnB protein
MFNGNCEEAFNYYKSAFQKDFEVLSRFAEMPENPNCVISQSDKNKIMHVSLPISDGSVLMGCDATSEMGESFVVGNNMTISINTNSEEETKKLFTALSQDGTVKMPLDKTFWGSYFGMLTNKFGIHWMVNCALDNKS